MYDIPSTGVPVNGYTRVSRYAVCPICGSASWCAIRSDGAVHCMRKESSQPARAGGGWWHHDGTIACADPPPTHQATASYPESAPAAALQPGALDRVYRALLSACMLSSEHTRYLDGSGIDLFHVSHYGTLPGNRLQLLKELRSHVDDSLLSRTPGLGFDAWGKAAINAPPSLLVGVLNADQQLVGMQARIEQPGVGKKYVWLSSAAMGGPSSGTPAHVAMAENQQTIYITEGVKKADVCATHTGCTTIGLPGHALHADGLVQLDILIDRGALCVVVALDEDMESGTALLVHSSRLQLYTACLARGLAVRVARWDPAAGKGIDDLYLAGGQPAIRVINALLAPEDPGQRDDKRKLSQSEEAARYRQLRRLYYNVAPDGAGRSMSASDKMALWGIWEQSDLYPGTIIAGGCAVAPVQVNLSAMADRVGVSRNTIGKIVTHLADAGVVIRTQSYDDASGHLRVAVAPARALAYNEMMPDALHRATDRSRKRCSSCGSINVATRYTCLDCGAVEQVDPCTESVQGPFGSEGPCTTVVPIYREGPCTESVTGHSVTISESYTPAAAATPTVSDQDLWRCLCMGRRGWVGQVEGGGICCSSCGQERVLPPAARLSSGTRALTASPG